MNAYEIADKLLAEVNCFDHQCAFDAANMLRQQADLIAELEKQLSQPMQILNDGRIVPVFKELSDEEIWEVWNTLPYDDQCPFDGRGIYNFARAILKKASEK
jgi:hypothetical protein